MRSFERRLARLSTTIRSRDSRGPKRPPPQQCVVYGNTPAGRGLWVKIAALVSLACLYYIGAAVHLILWTSEFRQANREKGPLWGGRNYQHMAKVT